MFLYSQGLCPGIWKGNGGRDAVKLEASLLGL